MLHRGNGRRKKFFLEKNQEKKEKMGENTDLPPFAFMGGPEIRFNSETVS